MFFLSFWPQCCWYLIFIPPFLKPIFSGLVLGHCFFLILLHHDYLQCLQVSSSSSHSQSNSKFFVFFCKLLEQFHPHAYYKPPLISYNFNSLYSKLQTPISNYLLSNYLNILFLFKSVPFLNFQLQFIVPYIINNLTGLLPQFLGGRLNPWNFPTDKECLCCPCWALKFYANEMIQDGGWAC